MDASLRSERIDRRGAVHPDDNLSGTTRSTRDGEARIPVAGTAVFLIGAMSRVVRTGGVGMGGYEWLLLVAIIGGVAFDVYSWRGPSCRKYLRITWNLRFCRKCGARLQ